MREPKTDLLSEAQPAPAVREQLLTVQELADVLRTTVRKVHLYCSRGMPHIQLTKRASERQFYLSQVDAWLKSRVLTGPISPEAQRRRAIRNRQPDFDQSSQTRRRGWRSVAG
jgi:hypothetical protein